MLYDPGMEPERAIRVLRQFLETDLLLGVAETPRRSGVEASGLLAAAPDAPGSRESPAGEVRGSSAARAPVAGPVGGRPARASTARANLPAAEAAPIDLGEGTPAERLARLAETLRADPDLADRFRGGAPALGAGGLPARVMFVGEPPLSGSDADEATKLLDGMVKAMKLEPAEVFRCPCLPFAPTAGDHPSPADLAAGAGALRAQVDLARPEVIVAMGGAAAKAVLGTSVGITRLRGTWATCEWTDPPTAVMPTLSPAFVLRSYTKDNRLRVWNDLQAVMAKLAPAGDVGPKG